MTLQYYESTLATQQRGVTFRGKVLVHLELLCIQLLRAANNMSYLTIFPMVVEN